MIQNILGTGLLQLALAQTFEEKAKYSAFHETMDEHPGYHWRPYTAVTKDDWELTLFRITGRDEEVIVSNKPSLLFVHGNAMDAASWVREQKGKPIFLELADAGYDVWMGNNRGTRYSNVYRRDSLVTEQQRWAFDFSDMGMYDAPAMLDTVIEHSTHSKATWIGYSQGTSQMFYSLVKLGEDFYQSRLDRFIALAPCLINPTDDVTVTEVQGYYEACLAAGVYTIGGDHAEENIRKVCDLGNAGLCATYKAHSGYKEGRKTQQYWQTWTVQNRYYWYQNAYEGVLQDWQPHKKWVPGNRTTQVINVQDIAQTRISFIVAGQDEICPVEHSKATFGQIKSPWKTWHQLPGHNTHGYFQTATTESGEGDYVAKLMKLVQASGKQEVVPEPFDAADLYDQADIRIDLLDEL